jgi:nucleoside-diphosphate-sugar epimerase
VDKVFIAGAAGFIGSNLVDRPLADGKADTGLKPVFTIEQDIGRMLRD